MGYTLREIKQLMDAARAAHLDGLEYVTQHKNTRLQQICNGIGPAAFPAWLRDKINFLHPTLEPVAMIHDCEWHENNGRLADFIASNRRFKENGYKAAKWRYGWYDPRRYIVMNQARRFGNLCLLFGLPAYKSATQQRRGGGK